MEIVLWQFSQNNEMRVPYKSLFQESTDDLIWARSHIKDLLNYYNQDVSQDSLITALQHLPKSLNDKNLPLYRLDCLGNDVHKYTFDIHMMSNPTMFFTELSDKEAKTRAKKTLKFGMDYVKKDSKLDLAFIDTRFVILYKLNPQYIVSAIKLENILKLLLAEKDDNPKLNVFYDKAKKDQEVLVLLNNDALVTVNKKDILLLGERSIYSKNIIIVLD